jgi:hypothetical protein
LVLFRGNTRRQSRFHHTNGTAKVRSRQGQTVSDRYPGSGGVSQLDRPLLRSTQRATGYLNGYLMQKRYLKQKSWRNVAAAALEHDPEKACPGLDPGWKPVFGQDHAPT